MSEHQTVPASIEYMNTDEMGIHGLPIITWGNLNEMDFPGTEWRIAGLVPQSGITILAGVSGERKTWFAMHMAYCIATGSHLFGFENFPTEKAKVLYIDAEMAPTEFQRRGRLLGFNNIPEGNLQVMVGHDLSIREEWGFELLQDSILENSVEVVIIDTLRGVGGGIPEDKAEEIRPFMNRFKQLKNKGVTVIILDHCRKPLRNEGYAPKKEQILGSQDKVASAESVLMIRSELHSNAFAIYPVKNRTGLELKPFMVSMIQQVGAKIVEFKYDGDYDEQTSKLDIAKTVIPQLIGTGVLTTKQVIKGMQEGHGIGERNVRETLRLLTENKQLTLEKIGREHAYKNTENGLLLLNT